MLDLEEILTLLAVPIALILALVVIGFYENRVETVKKQETELQEIKKTLEEIKENINIQPEK